MGTIILPRNIKEGSTKEVIFTVSSKNVNVEEVSTSKKEESSQKRRIKRCKANDLKVYEHW
jgi:hypothetical protein